MTRKRRGPKEESTTSILLNEHRIKLPSKWMFLYPQIRKDFIRETALCMVANAETHDCSEYREQVPVDCSAINGSFIS